jgi:D-alanyl-D-alanine carboxypeptidase
MRTSTSTRLVLVTLVLVSVAATASVAGGRTGGSAASLPALPTKPMGAAERARITANVRALLSQDAYEADVPGLILGIWSPRDGVYRASFGRADLESSRPPRLGSSFRIGSVSETFTATVILQLVSEHELSLRSPVRRYLPGLAKRYPAIGSRTVAQLLGMRSGLPEYADAAVEIVSRRHGRVWTADQLIALGMRSGVVRPAGASSATYSNTNDVILGEIARAVTGEPVGTLIRERLLTPLGLRHTRYPAATDARLPQPFTHGYVTSAGAKEIRDLGGKVAVLEDVTSWSPSLGNAAGSMSSTLDDLARWTNGLLGNVLLPKTLQEQRLRMSPMDDVTGYGLGMLQLRGGRWTGHDGRIPGWSTWALKDRRTGTVVVTSVNSCCGSNPAAFTFALLQKLYPDSLVSGPTLKSGVPYPLSPRATVVPTSGWTIDPDQSVAGVSLVAVKDGVVMRLSAALQVPAEQTFDAFAALLHDAEATASSTITPLAPYTPPSGHQGASWSTASVLGRSLTWLVTDGTTIVTLRADGSAPAIGVTRAEIERIADSIAIGS